MLRYGYSITMICANTDWRTQRLQEWRTTARLHVRAWPSAPVNLRGLTHGEMRDAIGKALGIAEGETKFSMLDYLGNAITCDAAVITSKLTRDVDHGAYAGWMLDAVQRPIEVWDRIDSGRMKRHYFSAFGNQRGDVMYYVSVATTLTFQWSTSFHKRSGPGIDEKRNGDFIFRCYG